MMKHEFNNYVKNLSKKYPSYKDGRGVIVLSEYSSAGKKIISRASHYDGYYLHQVYDRPSDAKRSIYNDLFDRYAQTEGAQAFSICSHNGFGFTVSWVEPGEVVYFTKDHEYHVICDE